MGTIGSLRAAIEQGYRRFDFMRGDEAYKASWGAQPVPTVETRVVARRSSAHLRHTAWLAHQQMRRGPRLAGSNGGARATAKREAVNTEPFQRKAKSL